MSQADNGTEAYIALGADINKPKGADTETKTGIVSAKLPELTLDMKDEDIVKLTDKWEKIWKESPKKQDWDKMSDENEKYWLGKQFDNPKADKQRAQVDNLIFESLETYLPLATRRNPEPVVSLDSSELDENGDADMTKQKYVEKVKNRLVDLADKLKLRLKLKKAARHHSIYLLGVAKFGWDLTRDIPAVRIIRPKNVILDPDATIDEDGYTGERVGDYRKLTASKILSIIGEQDDTLDESGAVVQKGNSEAIKAIKDKVKDDLDTEIRFIEWWTPQYMCWKMESTILLKKKNPHWNYDSEGTSTSVDAYGNETPAVEPIKGINHLPSPEVPYKFLVLFNLGDQPMDNTSLIGQNLANQDSVNKRNKQIDKNVDRMNGGMVVSLTRSGLTQPQAKGVTEALRKGGVVVIPDGAPRDAIDTYAPPALPSDVFGDRNDKRERLRDIFGIRGSSAAGLDTEDTVRGKILNRGSDTDRAGGGISESLEQFADDIYNWLVQLLYVYDPAFQFIQGAVPPKIVVSVKEGSLLPKDSASIGFQSLELAKLNRISNIDLYKRLEFPNPEEMAANVWLEANAPQLLYKDNPLVQEAIRMQQMAAQQKAEQDAMNAEQKNQNELKKEILKGDIKNNGSILEEVSPAGAGATQ